MSESGWLGRRKPPFEPLVQATILIVPLALGVLVVGSAALVTLEFASEISSPPGLASLLVVVYALGGLLLLGAGARFVHVRRVWKRRGSPVQGALPDSCPRRRRVAAQLVDCAVIGTIAVALGTSVWLRVSNHEVRAIMLLLGVLPLAALVHAAVSVLRRGERKGQTLGGQLFGIRTLVPSGSAAGVRRLCIREAVLKWLPFGCAAYAVLAGAAPHMPGYMASLLDLADLGWVGWLALALLGGPFVLDILWPLVDHRRRTLHDIVADTIVCTAV